MIFGAKEEIIPTYYDDDKPKSVQKIAFGLVRIILLWLRRFTMRKKLTIAFMYDFDKTLCDQDMQDYAFIPNLNMSSEEFWGETEAFRKKIIWKVSSVICTI